MREVCAAFVVLLVAVGAIYFHLWVNDPFREEKKRARRQSKRDPWKRWEWPNG